MNEHNNHPTAKPMKLSEVDPAIIRQIKINQTVYCLRMLMASQQIGPDQAMLQLRIPKKDRKTYRAILVNNKKNRQNVSEI